MSPSQKLKCKIFQVNLKRIFFNSSIILFHPAYYDFHIAFGNRVFGAGNSDGKTAPTGIIAMMLLGTLLEVMHINGLYQHRSDFLKIISALALYSICIQLVVALGNRFLTQSTILLLKVHDIAKRFYEREEKNKDHRSVLDSEIDKTIFTLKAYFPVSITFYFFPVITSILVSLWKHDFELAFNVYLPFTDPNTLFGFIFNTIILLMASAMVYVIFMIRDMHTIFYPFQVIPMAKVYALKLEEFAEKLSAFHNEKKKKLLVSDQAGPSTLRVTKEIEENLRKKKLDIIENKLIGLIKEYEVYNQYIELIVKDVSPMTFVCLLANSFAIGLSFLEMRLVSIPIGLALVAIFMFQVLLPCVIGTIISTQNEKLLQAVCEFPWYKLSPKMKKVYLQFIHQCQNTAEIELPIIGEANMELFTNIVNTSYSYLNYLINFT
jgi:hypothetical protein